VAATEEEERVAAVIVEIAAQLKLQGVRGWVTLSRALRDEDEDNSRSLAIGPFRKALANSSLKLSDQVITHRKATDLSRDIIATYYLSLIS